MKRAIVLTVLLASCEPPVESSPEMTEKAKVVQTIFAPSQHGTSSGTAISLKGKVSFVSTTVDIPSKYAIVFECEHGKFVIQDEGENSRAHNLWKKLKDGQQVTVRYKEVWQVREQVRHLLKYDFIDAEPASVEVEKKP